MLVVLSGLPGVGKTTLACAVALRVGGIHLRIDTIEAAMTESGMVAAAGGWDRVPDSGYQVGYALAADLLRSGHVVVADSVNPFAITRQAWAAAANKVSAGLLRVEIVCSDAEEHRRRVELRTSDLAGLVVPTWEQVQTRDYAPWDAADLQVDTAAGTDRPVDYVVAAIARRR
ncbi:hypothetical protein AWC30_01495 [Mycolicibacillus trivialis]|uniref:Adenylyl-sulfate kinase n=1 Tax=Mycolicibacillus trivialis TaxID=1798 RepID=A0A1X2EQT6_9MYCO|nr:hypothetical protein AWC30_01495 [Mycolicibacillus trivialis]